MDKNRIIGGYGGKTIQYESYVTIVFRSKSKERALKIKNILDERNKR